MVVDNNKKDKVLIKKYCIVCGIGVDGGVFMFCVGVLEWLVWIYWLW